MDDMERDSIVFEAEDGNVMEFSVLHEFCHDGSMFAVLRSESNAEDTLIAEVLDPLGPDEEFVPLPLKRQQELLEFLNRGGAEED